MDDFSRKFSSVGSGSLSQPSRQVISAENHLSINEIASSLVARTGLVRNNEAAAHSARKFTWKELSQLNQQHNAHVAYRGKVYDVSSFVSKHPGGLDQIMMWVGHDITHVFGFYHKREIFDQVLSKYYVGELVDNELPVFPTEESEFHRTLKQRVAKHMKENPFDPKIDYWSFFRYALLITSVFVTWYLALGAKYRLQDFIQVMNLKNVYIRMNPLSPSQWAMLWFGKIFHAAMRIIIPYFFLSLGNLVLLNIVYEAFNGLWLSFFAQVNHVFDEAAFPEPDDNNVVHTDWAELQVRTTLDYCTDSWLWYYIVPAGLSHQTAHHLFPGIMTAHCHRITPIVEQTCAEFGIKYNKANSFWDALLLHFTHLKKMGSSHPHLH